MICGFRESVGMYWFHYLFTPISASECNEDTRRYLSTGIGILRNAKAQMGNRQLHSYRALRCNVIGRWAGLNLGGCDTDYRIPDFIQTYTDGTNTCLSLA